ncbi:MAG: HAD-IA family hydrolase, partial [Jaaginema sp. PMC 1079.18]|nr:HAD-IA family hydrolase [Jaaginema sp. PMC 1079.18]
RRGKQEIKRGISSIQPISGMEAALQELKAQGYRLGILTSNRQDSVTTFLATNNLQNIFEFIDSDVTLFGKHRKIRRLLRLNRLNPQEFVYVGDETRDIEAAQKSKVWAIAVGWGFNAPALLARYNPDNLVTTPPALVAAIAQLTHLEN